MDKILDVLLVIPAILIAFTFHEYAHARVADRLGDKTARFQGRLTLNPAAHIDPIGFLMILIFKFGWAKPVQTNPSAYKNYYKDDLKVSLAGPLANLIIGVITAIIYGLYVRFAITILPISYFSVIKSMILNTIVINVNIFIFNLLPIPGLDGFHILEDLMPEKFYAIKDQLYRYQMIILFAIIFFGGVLISIPSEIIINLLLKLSAFVFGIF
ncbi:site-2 protease family protein [Clostridium uliginosum]|nr:site-2 protease family protein [Clostridium uliginosum]